MAIDTSGIPYEHCNTYLEIKKEIFNKEITQISWRNLVNSHEYLDKTCPVYHRLQRFGFRFFVCFIAFRPYQRRTTTANQQLIKGYNITNPFAQLHNLLHCHNIGLYIV